MQPASCQNKQRDHYGLQCVLQQFLAGGANGGNQTHHAGYEQGRAVVSDVVFNYCVGHPLWNYRS